MPPFHHDVPVGINKNGPNVPSVATIHATELADTILGSALVRKKYATTVSERQNSRRL
jgi:hypothetical protein